MGIAALGFCSFEGTHCTQVVTQRNATPPLLGDFDKSSIHNPTVKECDATDDQQSICCWVNKEAIFNRGICSGVQNDKSVLLLIYQ